MQIFLCENQSETYKALTESMLSVMKHNSERDFFMAISGGNTPLKLFEFWAHQYIHLIDWKHIQLFWVDERCVSPSDI